MRRSFLLALGVGNLAIWAIAAETPVDVSKIIKKSDAEAALGEPVKEPTPLNLSARDGYYSKCNYYSTKSIRSLIVRLRQATEGTIDPKQELEQVAASGGAMKPVEDLGDKAGMFDGSAQNGLPPNAIMLYVIKEKFFITIGLSGIKDENLALEKAKTVARKILAQL
ncbi:MAG TPA: hypothetical protein VGH08_08775 [Chthoniobacterales bacterium]|jgi:hypothetical protein